MIQMQPKNQMKIKVTCMIGGYGTKSPIHQGLWDKATYVTKVHGIWYEYEWGPMEQMKWYDRKESMIEHCSPLILVIIILDEGK